MTTKTAAEVLGKMREAVSKAAATFEYYAELHLAKETKDGREKAYTNSEEAKKLREALALVGAVGVGEEVSREEMSKIVHITSFNQISMNEAGAVYDALALNSLKILRKG